MINVLHTRTVTSTQLQGLIIQVRNDWKNVIFSEEMGANMYGKDATNDFHKHVSPPACLLVEARWYSVVVYTLTLAHNLW